LLDSPAGFFSGNEARSAVGFHSLLENAAGRGIDLNFRFVANKRIDPFGITHTLNVAHLLVDHNIT
jgi:hypothetical protein